MYLPERFTEELDEATSMGLNNSKVTMNYMGKDTDNRNRLTLAFTIIEDVVSSKGNKQPTEA